MTIEYDVVVLGSGVAGGVAARKLKAQGLSVALIEPGLLGGTCPLTGCEPKKVLFDAIDALVRCKGQSGHGLKGEPKLDWQELHRFKNSFTDPVPQKIEQDLSDRSIDLFPGQGRFVTPETIEAGSRQIRAERILICTGARPGDLNIPGEEYITKSSGFFDLERLPESMIVIGGGYIGFEFAHLAVRAGVKVSLLVRSDWCLKAFDPDLVGMLIQESQELGIDIHFNAPVESVEKDGPRYLVSTGGGSIRLKADLVVHAAGRVPNLEGLDCPEGQVEVSDQGIVVDEYLQSVSNPRVFAAGDVVAAKPQLTPVALMEAEAVVQNVLNGRSTSVDYTGVPSIVFTHPVMARAGRLEKECQNEGIEYQVKWADATNWSSYQRLGEHLAAVKILYHPKTEELLGVHLLGTNAEEVINVFALAIQQGIPRKEVGRAVWSYPSFVYDTVRHVLL